MTAFFIPGQGKRVILAVALLLGSAPFVGCTHARSAGDTSVARPTDRSPAENPPVEKPPVESDGRAGAPPLATSPSGLLKPGAVGAIQAKLVSSGHLSKSDESGTLDEPTRKALRGFQHDNNLPATGAPDDLTVQKLGLHPDQVFRATPKGGQDAR
jgi:hypothetical protein